jgi:CRISPR/Cas system-associated endonuclease Cas1
MKESMVTATVLGLIAAGDLKNLDFIEEHHGKRRSGAKRKAFRLKQIDPVLHSELQKRHMVKKMSLMGMTGKEARKSRKRAMKQRMRGAA